MGTTGEDVFHWWMEDGVLPGQINLYDLMEDDLMIGGNNETSD